MNEFYYQYGCGIIYETEETVLEYLERVGGLEIEEGEVEW